MLCFNKQNFELPKYSILLISAQPFTEVVD